MSAPSFRPSSVLGMARAGRPHLGRRSRRRPQLGPVVLTGRDLGSARYRSPPRLRRRTNAPSIVPPPTGRLVRLGLRGMKWCIISLATKHKRYPEGLARLQESVRWSGFTGELVLWPPGNFPEGCPAHEDAPYAFKPYCFHQARALGMDLVLWIDSSCVVLRKLDGIFRAMGEDGHALFRNRPHMVGQWASDDAIQALGLNREQAMRIPEINAAVVGLNLRSPVAEAFLDQWLDVARGQVAFRGVKEPLRTPKDDAAVKWNREGRASADRRVLGHRHDQTVAGILAHRLKMKLTTGVIEPYSEARRMIRLRTVIAIDRGVGRKNTELRSLEQIRRDRYLGGFAQLRTAIWGQRGKPYDAGRG